MQVWQNLAPPDALGAWGRMANGEWRLAKHAQRMNISDWLGPRGAEGFDRRSSCSVAEFNFSLSGQIDTSIDTSIDNGLNHGTVKLTIGEWRWRCTEM